jgi:hypothetical protein
MTNEEFVEKLKPLEPAMEAFAKTGGGGLTASEVGILKELYPVLKAMAPDGLPRVFKISCSSCVREVFAVYTSVYFRLTS